MLFSQEICYGFQSLLFLCNVNAKQRNSILNRIVRNVTHNQEKKSSREADVEMIQMEFSDRGFKLTWIKSYVCTEKSIIVKIVRKYNFSR